MGTARAPTPPSPPSTGAAGGAATDDDRAAAARVLQLRGLHAAAAPLLAGGDPIREARAWYAAGDPERALAALDRPDAAPSELLHILWRRLLTP